MSDEKKIVIVPCSGIGKVHGIATTEMSLTECEAPLRAR